MPAYVDSVDKIIKTYFVGVTRDPFQYKGKEYNPKRLVVSPLIFRNFQCPPLCGGCCPRFSLDYISWEGFPYELEKRLVVINGRSFPVYSDFQNDHTNHHCRNLHLPSGRCKIHQNRPMSCDFEILRFILSSSLIVPNRLLTRLFGRGWNFTRCTRSKGALCQIENWFPGVEKDIARRLYRLKHWADHFEIKTHLIEIIEWVESGPHSKSLIIGGE